jgi:hypothetical protein
MAFFECGFLECGRFALGLLTNGFTRLTFALHRLQSSFHAIQVFGGFGSRTLLPDFERKHRTRHAGRARHIGEDHVAVPNAFVDLRGYVGREHAAQTRQQQKNGFHDWLPLEVPDAAKGRGAT